MAVSDLLCIYIYTHTEVFNFFARTQSAEQQTVAGSSELITVVRTDMGI